MTSDSEKFPGFPPEMRRNFWMYPRVMDAWWHQLSGSEQKTLDFILRKTWGWEKQTDRISLSQFEKGIGLSQRQIVTATRNLESNGYVRISRIKGKTNEYSLVVQKMHQTSKETATGPGALTAHAGSQRGADTAYTTDSLNKKRIEIMYRQYSNIIRPGQYLSREAKRNMVARFAEYRPEQIIAAMKNASESDYWSDIVQTNTIAWFFSSEEQVARFLALGPHECPSDPKGQAKP